MANRNIINTRAPSKSNGHIRNRMSASPGHNVNSKIAVRTRKNAKIRVV